MRAKGLPCNNSFKESIHGKYSAYTETDPTISYLSWIVCGKGGVIMFKNSYSQGISYLQNVSSHKVSGIEINTENGNLFAFCIYAS